MVRRPALWIQPCCSSRDQRWHVAGMSRGSRACTTGNPAGAAERGTHDSRMCVDHDPGPESRPDPDRKYIGICTLVSTGRRTRMSRHTAVRHRTRAPCVPAHAQATVRMAATLACRPVECLWPVHAHESLAWPVAARHASSRTHDAPARHRARARRPYVRQSQPRNHCPFMRVRERSRYGSHCGSHHTSHHTSVTSHTDVHLDGGLHPGIIPTTCDMATQSPPPHHTEKPVRATFPQPRAHAHQEPHRTSPATARRRAACPYSPRHACYMDAENATAGPRVTPGDTKSIALYTPAHDRPAPLCRSRVGVEQGRKFRAPEAPTPRTCATSSRWPLCTRPYRVPRPLPSTYTASQHCLLASTAACCRHEYRHSPSATRPDPRSPPGARRIPLSSFASTFEAVRRCCGVHTRRAYLRPSCHAPPTYALAAHAKHHRAAGRSAIACVSCVPAISACFADTLTFPHIAPCSCRIHVPLRLGKPCANKRPHPRVHQLLSLITYSSTGYLYFLYVPVPRERAASSLCRVTPLP